MCSNKSIRKYYCCFLNSTQEHRLAISIPSLSLSLLPFTLPSPSLARNYPGSAVYTSRHPCPLYLTYPRYPINRLVASSPSLEIPYIPRIPIETNRRIFPVPCHVASREFAKDIFFCGGRGRGESGGGVWCWYSEVALGLPGWEL